MDFDLISAALGFLVGTATGAAGKYMADRFTDQRHRQESRAQTVDQLASVRAKVPRLLSELEADLRQSPLIREVIILPNRRIQYRHPHNRFAFYTEEHPDIRNELAFLVSVGYAEQTASGEFPLFRLEEHFASSLLGC